MQPNPHQIPPQYVPHTAPQMNVYPGGLAISPNNQKSKIAVLLFGIFLGIFGAHNFYLGYNGKAIAQLLITVLSLGFLAFISAIWALIESIMIFTSPMPVDGRGVPLRD